MALIGLQQRLTRLDSARLLSRISNAAADLGIILPTEVMSSILGHLQNAAKDDVRPSPFPSPPPPPPLPHTTEVILADKVSVAPMWIEVDKDPTTFLQTQINTLYTAE